MRIVIIEGTVYKVTEKQYKEIQKKEKEILKKEYYNRQQCDFSDYIDSVIQEFKIIGNVDFDFRL